MDAVLGFFKPTVVEKEREVKVVRLDAVDSTNAYLRTYTPAEDEPMTVGCCRLSDCRKRAGDEHLGE